MAKNISDLQRAAWLTDSPGLRFLLTAALAFVAIYALRLMEPVFMPVAIGGFLAVLSFPVLFWLEGRGAPRPLAVALTVLLGVGSFGSVVFISYLQLAELQTLVPKLQSAIPHQVDAAISVLVERWPDLEPLQERSRDVFGLDALLSWLPGTVGWVLTFVATTLLVTLFYVFALSEASVFPAKIRAIFGDFASRSGGRVRSIAKEVQGYLVIKTLVSLGTGISIALATWALGVEFPLLLGLIGFLLNYIPTIGSIIASVPGIALALFHFVDGPVFGGAVSCATGTDVCWEFLPQRAVLVALTYLGLNIVFGNWIEPQLYGRRLGLSTFVVVLSLVFWNWLWGPVGALLSVPLTMVVKIMLENTEDLKWVALLLDNRSPEESSESAGLGSAEATSAEPSG